MEPLPPPRSTAACSTPTDRVDQTSAATEQPTQTQKSPASFIGILTGLGVAAVVVLRHK